MKHPKENAGLSVAQFLHGLLLIMTCFGFLGLPCEKTIGLLSKNTIDFVCYISLLNPSLIRGCFKPKPKLIFLARKVFSAKQVLFVTLSNAKRTQQTGNEQEKI